jgi:hypothetical protein
VPEMDVRSSRWLSIQGSYLLTSRAGTPPTGERLGGTSDPQALMNCGRDASFLAPPAQIRTGSFPAYGSYLGCLASKRMLG